MPSGVYIRTEEHKRIISEASRGRHHSEETKRKISEALMGDKNPFYGKHHSEETKKRLAKASEGNINMLGKYRSEETKKKISDSRKGKNTGSKNPMWKGGITSIYMQIRTHYLYRQWRSNVFTRDNFTCQECGKKDCKLNTHHKKSFNSILQKYEITTMEEALECSELWNINNGITLCEKCHINIHGNKGEIINGIS